MNYSIAKSGFILIMTIILIACASMTEQECREADWRAIGMRDGLSGETVQKIDDHKKACGKIGIFPNESLWLDGRVQGISTYCTANGAWNAGLANRVYKGVCINHDESTFLRYHNAGLAVWRAQYEISKNRDQIVRLDAELRKATKDEDRKRLQDDISRHERERDRQIVLLTVLELAGPPR